jgi:hypothetical protein
MATATTFRRLALRLPETIEMQHMGHPDFRVNGKIFATLSYPSEEWGMVKLSPDQQRRLVESYPGIFTSVKGAWGLKGCTNVRLKTVPKDLLFKALTDAWANAAPKQLLNRRSP